MVIRHTKRQLAATCSDGQRLAAIDGIQRRTTAQRGEARRYHADAMTAVTNPEHAPEGHPWPRGTLRLYPLLCELSWVFDIGEAPPGVSGCTDDAPNQESEFGTALGPRGPEALSGLDPQVRRLLSRVDVPAELMQEAVPRFMEFRREFEALGLAHRGACLRAYDSTRHADFAALPRQLLGLSDFVEGLRAALARWELASTAGPSPIVGAFAAGLVRGVHGGRNRPLPSVPSLRIVPGVDSGDVLPVLAFGHGVDNGDRSVETAKALGLQPTPLGRGRLVGQPQLIDARLWTLRRIGGVAVNDLASWQGVSRQQIDRVLDHLDRALENGLPRPRLNPPST